MQSGLDQNELAVGDKIGQGNANPQKDLQTSGDF